VTGYQTHRYNSEKTLTDAHHTFLLEWTPASVTPSSSIRPSPHSKIKAKKGKAKTRGKLRSFFPQWRFSGTSINHERERVREAFLFSLTVV
jgi:hypothetical protein